MPSTYTPIATASVSTSSYTFNSIPATYTDIVLVAVGTSGGSNINYAIRCNNDATAGIYSSTRLYSSGSSGSQTSDRLTSYDNAIVTNFNNSMSACTINFSDYANTTKYKSFFGRTVTNSSLIWLNIGQWRSTSAINAITFLTTTGNTFTGDITLYGIKSA